MSGLILTIAQQKGGSGKTTLSAHLATALAYANMRVAVLDCDPQGSLGEWLEERESRLGADSTGLTFRTASGWGARREAKSLSRDHDAVVIDTPPKSDTEARPAIEVGHLVVVPVQPSPMDVWACGSTIELARAEKTATLLVLNRVPPRAAITDEMTEALAEIDSKLAKTRIGNRVGFAGAMNLGLTIMDTDPSGKGAKEITSLRKEVVKAAKAAAK
ncbi:MAG: ParA family protein [Devosiaceae bacterium]|nr:ParA family protein [Devosiaceae bacterium MH13]